MLSSTSTLFLPPIHFTFLHYIITDALGMQRVRSPRLREGGIVRVRHR